MKAAMRVPRLYIVTIGAVIAASIIVAYPSLVVFGFLALFLPGLVMAMMPTAAFYLTAASVLHVVLPSRLGNWRIPAAFAGALCVGLLIVQPSRHAGFARFYAANLPDIVASAPAPVSGNIMVHWFGQTAVKREERQPCDAFCAALLTTPGVASVTLSSLAASTTWRLVPRGSAPDLGLAPVHPEQLDWSSREAGFARGALQTQMNEQEAVAASWALRLATKQTLVAEQSAPVPDFTITVSDQRDETGQQTQRVELHDRAEMLLLRRSRVTVNLPAQPLWFDLFGAFANHIRFIVARQLISTGPALVPFDAVHELLEHVAIPRPAAPQDAPDLMRQQLAAALDTQGEPGGLALAEAWIDSLGYGEVAPEDTLLFRKIIGDHRIRDIAYTITKHRRLLQACDCGDVVAGRIVALETSPEDRGRLADALVRMPPGSFASMTENERRIIDDPKIRQDVPAFVERLGDAGKPALGTLMALLREAVRDPDWRARAAVVRAIRKGLARMGNQAGDALPEVRDLFEHNPSTVMQLSVDELWWRVTLVRMGLPVTQLTYPSDWSQAAKDKEQRDVIAALARYQPGQ